MADLHDLLVAEARRQQPLNPPPFEVLVRARRSRDRRNRVAAGSLLTLAVLAAIVLPGLLRGARVTPAVTASSGQHASVTGFLRMPGGPGGAGQPGVSGVVVFTSPSGDEVRTRAGSDGRFAVSLPPGSYTVTGTSPQFEDGRGGCRADGPVTVGAGGRTGVVVACPTRSAGPAPAASVTARITLPSKTIRTGGSMSATITVENKSGKPVHLVGCGSIYAALLVGASHHPTASWPLCAQQITVPVGESSYPVTVSAAFNQCTAEGGAGPEPACLADGSLPPLPAGRYELMTTAVSPELPVPAPVAVTVTP